MAPFIWRRCTRVTATSCCDVAQPVRLRVAVVLPVPPPELVVVDGVLDELDEELEGLDEPELESSPVPSLASALSRYTSLGRTRASSRIISSQSKRPWASCLTA